MNNDIRIARIIKTSIITAFSIAAALIWKDVIIEIINMFVPPGERLVYKFLVAVLATIVLVVAIYLVLKTSPTAEKIILRLDHHQVKRKKRKKRNG